MLIERVRFKNFKVLRDAELPLGQLTVLVGANGSGKSTALEAIMAFKDVGPLAGRKLASAASPGSPIHLSVVSADAATVSLVRQHEQGGWATASESQDLLNAVRGARLYSFNPRALSQQSTIAPDIELAENGQNLPTELDQLRDRSPERFEALNSELHRWLPEFDRVLFDTPGQGLRALLLRYGSSGASIPALELSYGTLAVLGFLAVAYRSEPPAVVCFEEPDRGIHPRLLPKLQEALYRLAYPASFGETREPTQVIVTTHSPYFLDLFKDHPEEVVVAERLGEEAQFKRLVDIPDFEEILEGVPLGEVWYSGLLGGVPAA